MKIFHRTYLGLVIGFIGTTILLAAGGAAWVTKVSAQTQNNNNGLCFLAGECVGGDRVSAACKSSAGCCSDVHCFVPDAACDALGDVKGAGRCYAKNQPVNLIVPIGKQKVVLDLGDYLAALYTYSLSVAGILATVLMMVGGFQYLVGQQSEGRKRILEAVGGMLITFFAYLVLQTVNPALVTLKLPQIPVVKRKDFALCQYADHYAKCGEKFGIKQEATVDILKNLKFTNQQDPAITKYLQFDPAKLQGAEIVATCMGKGCSVIGGGCTNDTQFTCTTQSSDPQAVQLAQSCKVADTNYNPSSAFCTTCSGVGTACGKGLAPCCGGCNAGKCIAGTLGQPCSLGTGCAKGFSCVSDPSVVSMFVQIVSSGSTGVCYAGGMGMPCGSSADCNAGLTCNDGFQNLGFKFCSPGPIQVEPPPTYCTKKEDCPGTLNCASVSDGSQTINVCAAPTAISAKKVDTDLVLRGIRITSKKDGEAYSVDYQGSNSAWRCETERHVKYFETSTTAALFQFGAGNYEIGLCSDGQKYSVCNPGAGPSACANGLFCVKPASFERGWLHAAFDQVTRIGISDSFKDLGVCLEGLDGDPCTSNADCKSSLSCVNSSCASSGGAAPAEDSGADTFVPVP